MTNESIVAQIQAGENVKDNLERLYTDNKPLLFDFVKPFLCVEESDDLMQETFFGLYHAALTYDQGSGCKFMSYAETVIHNHLKRATTNAALIHRPEYQHKQLKAYRVFCESFEDEHGRAPADQDIINGLNISAATLETLRNADKCAYIKSLDAPITSEDGEENTLADLLPCGACPESEIVDKATRAQLADDLREMLESMHPNIAESMKEHYFQGVPFSDMACGTNTAKKRVKLGLKHFREPRNLERLRQYVEEINEYRREQAHKGTGLHSFQRTGTSATERAAIKVVQKYG